MEVFSKFLIIDNHLLIAKCTYHNEILHDISCLDDDIDEKNIQGGGWYFIKNDTITFYGDSHEFKKAKYEDIVNCINTNNVYYMYDNISNKYSFNYRDDKNNIIKIK